MNLREVARRSPITCVTFSSQPATLHSMRKALVVLLNLALGNSILWFFETQVRNQDQLDLTWALAFSLAAIVLLTFAFKLIRPNQNLRRSIVLAAGVSFFVPIFGLVLSFINLESLNGTIVGGLVALVAAPMLWPWAVPMFLANTALLHWVARDL